MSSCITRSNIDSIDLVAEWLPGDAVKKRKLLEKKVSEIVGHNTTSNRLPSELIKIIVHYLESYACFGEREWTTLCGRVNPAPLLPHDFSAIWNGPCPIFPGKKVRETHMLVYIPATVDGEPFTLKKLGEIAKRYFQENDSGYRYIWPSAVETLGDRSIDKPGWRLMTRDVFPGSRHKSYDEQQKIVSRLAKKSLMSYEFPDSLEAATCILSQYFALNTRLFSDNPWTYTRCKDKVQNLPIVVGGFASIGLRVDQDSYGHKVVGVAALWKL